jgi:3-oxoacyl-[acyl-carrier-protein] synthase-1
LEKAAHPLKGSILMKDVFVAAHNIISPLGLTSAENFAELKAGHSGVQLQNRPDISPDPFWAGIIDEDQFCSLSAGIKNAVDFTRFERFVIASVNSALEHAGVNLINSKTVFILSTTKGNISLLEQPITEDVADKLNLFYSAQKVSDYFQFAEKPVVISNACISGSAAILFAKRLLETGQYESAVVTGADTISKFVFSGFQAFQALSPGRCRPFLSDRDGINLGEAAATIVLTTDAEKIPGRNIKVSGGATSNDANHISGPSRTGAELSAAIDKAIELSGVDRQNIDFISAHGTGTLFNDEMEAKAFNLSNLKNSPVNSLKSHFGHTLGAAGILESVISIMSLEEGIIIPTFGFSGSGVSLPINLCADNIKKEMNSCLKTASGFGGCNAALVFSKS